MRNFVSGLAAILLLVQPAAADPIDDIVREQMAASHVPGVAVAIVDQGRVTKVAGYGEASLEWSQKVAPDTKFQLASATKLFTAILLMRLVEQGRLSLDDPIGKFFPGGPESWARIRVRQLANHSSGLSEDLGQPAPASVEETVSAAMRTPLAYEPGAESRYGFTDFTVLRAILEKVGEAPLPELLDREIIRPLALADTGFAMAEDKGDVRTGEVLARRASIYGWNGTRQRTSDFYFSPLGYGAGGLFSSARDLAKLFAAIDEGRVLQPASLAVIAEPAKLDGGATGAFGIGWTVRDYRGTRVVGHSGGPALADILRIPASGRTIIVLTNQRIFYPILAERIADLTLGEPPLASLPDDRPKVGRTLRALFDGVLAREDVSALVAGPGRPDEPLHSEFGRALLEAVGPVQAVTLAGVEPGGARTYRVRFARKVMDWTIEADGSDRITGLRPAR